jgi:DNA-binding CsgD family transcriptional regulator
MYDLPPDAEAVVFVDDPEADAILGQIGLWSASFRLTPAEARLAMHLASGDSLRDAADALGVTYNTVRAQMRAIFDKTDIHRQADLVRLLHQSTSLRVSLT